MAELEPGAKVAKDLGIYLGQIYNYVKKGLVTNHKEDGYPTGKGLIVDPDEVKAAMGKSRRKGGGPGKGKSGYVRKADRVPKGEGEERRQVKARRLPTGTIVSYEGGQLATTDRTHARPPHYNLATVLGTTGHLTYLDKGRRYVHYNGMQIDNVVFGTDRLSTMLARGVAHIEHPVNVLGMVLLAFVTEGKTELAKSLEGWLEENDLPVIIPEILSEPDDEDLEDEAAQSLSEEEE